MSLTDPGEGVGGGGCLLALFIHNPHTSLDLVLPVNIAPGCSAGKARGDSRLFGDILVPVA